MLHSFSSFNLLLSMPGGSEWILIIAIVLLMFGGKKVPELMRGIGRGVREFKDAKNHVTDEIEKGMQESSVKENTTPVASTSTL